VCVLGFLSLAFLVTVSEAIRLALPETDLWWMIPTMAHYVDGKPLAEVVGFLLSPAPLGLGQPALKIYLFLATSWLGLQTQGLIIVALLVHVANAAALFVLGTRLSLGPRISAWAAVTYLTLFAHFHAYLWPTASQHVIGLFFILIVLNLYLTTDERWSSGRPYRWYWVATLGAGLLASLQRSTLIAPALMLTHILIASGDDRGRLRRFDLWLLFFLVYLIYPVAALAFVGDVILTTYFALVAGSPVVKFMLLLLGGALTVLVARVAVAQYPKVRRFKVVPWLSLALVVALFVALSARDVRNLLLPYHVLVPFVSMLATALGPIQYALAIDSTEAFHFIPPAFGSAWVVAGLVLIAVFGKAFVASNRSLALLVTWYGLSLAHLLFQYSSHPVHTPSRYFIYLSPVVAIVFCAVVVRAYDWMTARVGGGRLVKELGLAAIIIALLLPNLVAIKVEWLRGRLANTYLVYDYIRVAGFIEDDLAGSAASGARIHVSNVIEMPFREVWTDFSPVDPSEHASFRLIMNEVVGNGRVAALGVNDGRGAGGGGRTYVISDHRVADERGRQVGRFDRLYAETVTRLRGGDDRAAAGALDEAMRVRPFLLNYVLGDHRLSDLRWVTNGLPMRTWVRRMAEKATGQETADKPRYVAAVIDSELSEYILCLFYMSYLEATSGQDEESRSWLSEIRYLEDDPAALSAWIGHVPLVKEHAGLLSHVTRFRDPLYFREPLPWRQDDYGLERFLVRLFLKWDVRSKRERHVGV